jgi:folate-binding protein YgfZ
MIFMAPDHARVEGELDKDFAQASLRELEAWRIASGVPRVGVDVAPEDLPQEGGLEQAVSFGKGCFLGQEAVARVRNLGHPRRVLLTLQSDVPMAPGDPVHADGTVVGSITSATNGHALAKVRWGAREASLRTADGAELRSRSLANISGQST